MLPWIIGGALAAAGALLWYLLRKKKQDQPPPPSPQPQQQEEEEGEEQKSEDEAPSNDAGTRAGRERLRVEVRDARAIERIVQNIRFSVGRVIHKSVKVGEETRVSVTPTDQINVRPMQGVQEMPRVLSSAHALPDDAFYAKVATNELPVPEYLEQVDIVADVEEPSRNVVVTILDMSTSMQESNRMPWSIGLLKRIFQKAQAENAEVAFLPFGSSVGQWIIARTDEERAELINNLERHLYWMGGTNIPEALYTALQYVSDPSFTERKMVIVTDGEQTFDGTYIRNEMNKLEVELHTVCVGPPNNQLRHISNHFDHLSD